MATLATEAKTAASTISWFNQRVLKPRLLAAFIWGTLIGPLAGGVALTALGSSLAVILSFSLYRLLFWTSLAMSFLSYLTLDHLHVVPCLHSNRVSLCLALLRPGFLVRVAIQAILGSVICKSVVGVANPAFDALVYQIDVVEGSSALHEGVAFIGASGAFAAVTTAIRDVITDANAITFFSLPLGKLQRIKRSIPTLAFTAFKEAITTLKWFFLFYFFFGGRIKDTLCSLLVFPPHCPRPSTTTPMNSILGLLEIGILWKSFVSVSLLLFCRRLLRSLVVAYVAEPLTFRLACASPLTQPNDEGEPSLETALNGRFLPLTHHLAFRHLASVVQGGSKARRPFFQLSQPGGHPHAWNNVSTACLDQLSSLASKVAECNSVAPSNNAATKAEMPSKSGVLRLSPFKYLLMDFPAIKVRKVFVDYQISIWSVESLSHLIAASFVEDEYGVVQKKLGELLEILVGLYEGVEKNVRLFPNGPRADSTDDILVGRQAFRSAIKSSLYRITLTFGSHTFGIQGLTPEVNKRLKAFVEMKE